MTIYAVVLMSIAVSLISQHWLVAVLGLVTAAIYYLNTLYEKEGCIAKFGDEYRR